MTARTVVEEQCGGGGGERVVLFSRFWCSAFSVTRAYGNLCCWEALKLGIVLVLIEMNRDAVDSSVGY